MIQRGIIWLFVLSVVMAINCSLSGSRPGTGGTNSAAPFARTSHPDVPEGVRCYVCHKTDIPQVAFHQSFSSSCEQCHDQTTWTPFRYPHAHWPLGIHRQVQCVRCHPNIQSYDFTVWQCWVCHHEPVQHMTTHVGRGTTAELENCLACHKGFPETAAPK